MRKQVIKSQWFCVGVLLSIMIASCINAQSDNFPILKGPYLGQKPPGNRPEVFALGIISVDANFEHSAAVFSPDGNEVFWCTNIDWYTDKKQVGGLRLYYMKTVDGRWTVPQPAPFAEDIQVERPVFSPDGARLYFEALADANNMDDMDIFMVERKCKGWSEPVSVSPLINTPAIERLHCVTSDGSMYFTRNLLRYDEAVLVSTFVDGVFTSPKELGEGYNADVAEYAIVLSQDENYMLICQQAGMASANVFVSYRNADGTWSDRIETPYYSGGFLALSPDGKYLFIENEGVHWISTSFVEAMKPANLH